MAKNFKKIISVIIVVASFFAAFYFYPKFPDTIPSHWDINGKVNGYMPKIWGLFLMPSISALMLVLFLAIPKIDPLKENIKKFRGYFDSFVLLVIIFMAYIYALTIAWVMGARFDMNQAMPPALGVLFFCAGILAERAKRNWFIGIRTPWTMENDQVWEKTNKLGGKLFKASGVICFLGLAAPKFAFYFMIIPAAFTAVYVFIYSFLEYKKIVK